MGVDFQNLVDGIDAMTCVVSVEDLGGGRYGEIRIVTGNRAYIDSIEHPMGDVQMLTTRFQPNSLYTEYLTKDLNFEDTCYRAAVGKKCLHSYVHPDRFDVWFDMTFLPVAATQGNLHYCTYTMVIDTASDPSKMSAVSEEISSAVLQTCIRLRGARDFKAAMQDVIRDIRQICGANRCCVLLMDTIMQTCSMLCEDLADDSSLRPLMDLVNGEINAAFYELALSWESTISGSNCLIAKNEQDMQVVKERNPFWYQSLVDNGVKSIVLFPLKSGNKLVGYIWVTNFDAEQTSKIKEAMEVTTFILGSEIANYLLVGQLRILSSRDMLTGVCNRNQMNHYVDALANGTLSKGQTVGVVFADLNGLKTVNDVDGHHAGDTLLKNAAFALCDVFAPEEIFRAGGDEFTMILIGITKEELEKKVAQLREASTHYDKVNFAIGYYLESDAADVRSALHIADQRMYEDKRMYYRQHPELKKR